MKKNNDKGIRLGILVWGILSIVACIVMCLFGVAKHYHPIVQPTQVQVVVGQPEVPVSHIGQTDTFVMPTNQSDDVTEVAVATPTQMSAIVRDAGASVKMMPAVKEQPVVVPENSVRKSR